MTTQKIYTIEEVFSIIKKGPIEKNYTFVEDHPVDIKSARKYFIHKYWYERSKLYCFSCLKPATHYILKRTKGEGSIYKPDGRIKYTFMLHCEDESLITIDHWYSKQFLRKNHLPIKTIDNTVPMCKECNKHKNTKTPIVGLYGKTFHIPNFTFAFKGNGEKVWREY